MDYIVLDTLGDAIRALEELEMEHKDYILQKGYDFQHNGKHYKVGWVIFYGQGLNVDNIPEEMFED